MTLHQANKGQQYTKIISQSYDILKKYLLKKVSKWTNN